MFKNLKIGNRLAISFGFVLFLLTTICVLAVLRVGQISNDIDKLVNDKYPKTVWANNIVNHVNIIARALRNSLLVTDPKTAVKELTRVSDSNDVIDLNIANLEQSVRSEEGKKVFAKVVETGKAYLVDQNKFLELQKAGRKNEAVELMLTGLRKSQGEYLTAIGELIEHQSKSMEESGAASLVVAGQTRILIIVLGIAAFVLATLSAWWVTHSITRPTTWTRAT
jgi:methyl-accepting chemotaxis protein